MQLQPQPGPQTDFAQTKADIAIFGGAAGGGKSYALLLEPLRHVIDNPLFSAVFFRRTTTQITNPGGLWDAAGRLYPLVRGIPRVGNLEWLWSHAGGGKVKMAHLEHEHSVNNYQGAEIPLLAFDELTHFSSTQFWYMVSRNRSMSGIKGYVRATCNPDADSWVAKFIEWWINPVSGLPIPERSGVLRWVMRVNDTLHWADQRKELIEQFRGQVPDEALQPKSVTFIPSKLTDNKALMEADPAYMANLLALPTVERERLLGGNWRIRPAAGLYFQRRWLKPVHIAPKDTKWVRGWDLAGTPKTETNDPDFTSSTLIGRSGDRFFIGDNFRFRGSPAEVETTIRRTAAQDKASGRDVLHSLPQDPGQSGKSQAASYSKLLLGFRFRFSTESRMLGRDRSATPMMKAAKVGRFGPFSAQCEAGNVCYVVGDWNETYFDALEAFPEALHDDDADSTSRAFEQFLDNLPGAAMLEIAERHNAEITAQAKPEPIQKTYAPGSVEFAMALLGKRPEGDDAA